jgi:hypothetical protein
MGYFAALSLERKHGDLGSIGFNRGIPPLSTLGTSIREDWTGNAAELLIEYLLENARRNTAIAALLFDVIHGT